MFLNKVYLLKIYILKTKGTAKIPDYVQIRDHDFVLSSHFTVSDIENALGRDGFTEYKKELVVIICDLPFGELRQFEL